MYDTAGDIYGVICTAIEVTERVEVRRKLLKSEQDLRLMIQQAPIAICMFRGHDYRLQNVNPQMAKLFGRDVQAVEGLPLFEALPEVQNLGLEETLEGVVKTGKTFVSPEQSFQFPRQHGIETVWVKYIYEPIKNDEGEVERIMVLAIDVTEQVLARQKIEEVVKERTKELATANETFQTINRELQRSNANLEEFAHAASHDLKEPVRKIHFFTNQLKTNWADR